MKHQKNNNDDIFYHNNSLNENYLKIGKFIILMILLKYLFCNFVFFFELFNIIINK